MPTYVLHASPVQAHGRNSRTSRDPAHTSLGGAPRRSGTLIPALSSGDLFDPLNSVDMTDGEFGQATLLQNLPLVPCEGQTRGFPMQQGGMQGAGSMQGVQGRQPDGMPLMMGGGAGGRDAFAPGISAWSALGSHPYKATSAPVVGAQQGMPSPADFLAMLRGSGAGSAAAQQLGQFPAEALSGPEPGTAAVMERAPSAAYAQGERTISDPSITTGGPGRASESGHTSAVRMQHTGGSLAALKAASPRGRALATLMGLSATNSNLPAGPVHVDVKDPAQVAGVHSAVLAALWNRAGLGGAAAHVPAAAGGSNPASGSAAAASGGGGNPSSSQERAPGGSSGNELGKGNTAEGQEENDEDDDEDEEEDEEEDARQEAREEEQLRAAEVAEMQGVAGFELADDDGEEEEEAGFDVAKYRVGCLWAGTLLLLLCLHALCCAPCCAVRNDVARD